MNTFITGGRLVTADRQDRVADLLVENGRIAAIADRLPPPPDAEVIDATGMLVLPGFVDTHRHTWQTVLRHRSAGWSLTEYLSHALGGFGDRFRPEDVYAGTLLGALSALDAGITTLVDWSHIQNTPAHADAAVEALTDAGIRAVFAHGWPVGGRMDPTAGHPRDLRRVRTELLPDDDGLVTLAMGARGPDFTDISVTTEDFRFARELGVPITAHVAGGVPGEHQRGIERLAEAGLLGPDLTLIHLTGASDEALKMLAEHGVGASISPQIELTMPGLGSRVAVDRLLRAGVRTGLSVDSETAAAADLFTQLRIALAAHRAAVPDDPLPAAEILRLATTDGATVAGLGDRTGSLEVGKAADLVLIPGDAVNLTPLTAPAEAVVLAAHPGNVDTVLVAGRQVKRAGRLLADLDRARTLASESASYLFPRSTSSRTSRAIANAVLAAGAPA